MTRPVVLMLEPLHAAARELLGERATVHELPSPEAPLDHLDLDRIDGLVTRGRGRVDAALLARLGSLRAVIRAGVGLDNVDRGAASARNVAVLNVPNALTATVAEHAIALALAARRDVVNMGVAARRGAWSERDQYRGEAIAGARVCVAGMGAIGARATSLFRSLGADVVTWSRSPREDSAFEPSLDRAVEGADVVSLHMALTPGTRGILGGDRLERLRHGATVVNTARPGLVDRAAMLTALESGRVASYAVDGFEPEPPKAGDPLLDHPRVLVTPHVAALTQETYVSVCRSTVLGLLDFLHGVVPTDGAQVVAAESSRELDNHG